MHKTQVDRLNNEKDKLKGENELFKAQIDKLLA